MTESQADGVLQARRVAMDALGRREHSHLELSKKLQARGLDEVQVEIALAELEHDGLLSDARFADALVHSRARRGKGPVRIRIDLEERGVSSTLIDQALESADIDWYQLAREVRLKRFGDAPVETMTQRAKQHRFLHYRGFDGDQIKDAVE